MAARKELRIRDAASSEMSTSPINTERENLPDRTLALARASQLCSSYTLHEQQCICTGIMYDAWGESLRMQAPIAARRWLTIADTARLSSMYGGRGLTGKKLILVTQMRSFEARRGSCGIILLRRVIRPVMHANDHSPPEAFGLKARVGHSSRAAWCASGTVDRLFTSL